MSQECILCRLADSTGKDWLCDECRISAMPSSTLPRISTVLASTPFVFSRLQLNTPVGHSHFAQRLAEDILKSRRTIVFADELHTDPSLRVPGDQLARGLVGMMLPKPQMLIEWTVLSTTTRMSYRVAVALDWCGDARDSRCELVSERWRLAEEEGAELEGVVVCSSFAILPTGPMFMGTGAVGVTRDGHRMWHPNGEPSHPLACRLGEEIKGVSDPEQVDMITSACGMACHAICLMNSRGMQLVEGGRTNADVSPRRRAAERLPWVVYHVIKIKKRGRLLPLPVFLDKPTDGRGRPLVYVNGHYRDYSNSEKGMFGRLRGEKYSHVWIWPHFSGSSDNGVVVSDYELDADWDEEPDVDGQGLNLEGGASC